MISKGMVRSNSECRRVVKEAAKKAKILIAEGTLILLLCLHFICNHYF